MVWICAVLAIGGSVDMWIYCYGSVDQWVYGSVQSSSAHLRAPPSSPQQPPSFHLNTHLCHTPTLNATVLSSTPLPAPTLNNSAPKSAPSSGSLIRSKRIFHQIPNDHPNGSESAHYHTSCFSTLPPPPLNATIRDRAPIRMFILPP